MSLVYFSTVIRGGLSGPISGEFVCVDWGTKAPVGSSPVTMDRTTHTGRGGGRGMWATANRVYGVTRNTVMRFDSRLSDPSVIPTHFAQDIHEVMPGRPGTLWVASNRNDKALCIDLATGTALRKLSPVGKDALRADGPFHYQMTALAMWHDQLHALCARPGIIVNLETPAVVLRHALLKLAHNLVVVGDSAWVCSTPHRTICEFDLSTGALLHSVDLIALPEVKALAELPHDPEVAQPVFLRGLSVQEGSVFVGISPATILHLSWPDGALMDSYQHSDDIHVAIHGLSVVA